eukprot:7200810-Prymnesium_polylepis.1
MASSSWSSRKLEPSRAGSWSPILLCVTNAPTSRGEKGRGVSHGSSRGGSGRWGSSRMPMTASVSGTGSPSSAAGSSTSEG